MPQKPEPPEMPPPPRDGYEPPMPRGLILCALIMVGGVILLAVAEPKKQPARAAAEVVQVESEGETIRACQRGGGVAAWAVDGAIVCVTPRCVPREGTPCQ